MKNFDWTKWSGYIASAVIVVVMVVLNLCGVVKIDNVDSACKYTKESVKIATMSYFTLSKDEFTSEKADEIVSSVLTAIANTTEQVKAGKIDLADMKTSVISEIDKVIDEKAKNPEMAKKLANIMINAGFSSFETYSSEVAKDSEDYAKLLNAISEGIQEGYKAVYPDEKKVSFVEIGCRYCAAA